MLRVAWDELNPVVTHANYIKCQPGFHWGPRTIYEHQFIYIIRGKGISSIQDRSYQVGAGDLFYYGPRVGHYFRADDAEPFEILGMHFEFIGSLADSRKPPYQNDIEHTAQDTGIKNLVFIGTQGLEELKLSDYINVNGTAVEEVFIQALANFRNDNNMTAMINRGLLLHLFDLLHKHTHQMTAHLSPQLKTLYHVRSRLIQSAEMPYSRIWIRDWSGYNEDYLSRNFREHFGVSPHQFHLLQKIEKAKYLLEHTDSSITEISERLNFNSIHYFCRLFKMHVVLTPLQYKKQRVDLRI